MYKDFTATLKTRDGMTTAEAGRRLAKAIKFVNISMKDFNRTSYGVANAMVKLANLGWRDRNGN